jgi:hypothetical protein
VPCLGLGSTAEGRATWKNGVVVVKEEVTRGYGHVLLMKIFTYAE